MCKRTIIVMWTVICHSKYININVTKIIINNNVIYNVSSVCKSQVFL